MINNLSLDFKHIKNTLFQKFSHQIKFRGTLILLKTIIVNHHRIMLNCHLNHKGKHKKLKISSLDKKVMQIKLIRTVEY